MNKAFVYVVCGEVKHIDRLNFSIFYLKKNTDKDIYIVTDLSRNERTLEHDKIINIKVPKKYNDKQASRFLKTNVANYLPQNNLYCYLDSDIIPISKNVDAIFNEFKAPIMFAKDHCLIDKFSAYAINCSCLSIWDKDRELFGMNRKTETTSSVDFQLLKKRKELQSALIRVKENHVLLLYYKLKNKLAFDNFKLKSDFIFSKKSNCWIEKTSKKVVLYGKNDKKDKLNWLNLTNINIGEEKCLHLLEYIGEKFNININNTQWNHWNGGVFLFNRQSQSFLNSWHQKTLKIFDDPAWKDRDQGALIATVWENHLENHSTLAKEWNFIAEYNNKELKYNKVKNRITDNNWKTSTIPNFIHVYHNWGDEKWSFWNDVKNFINEN